MFNLCANSLHAAAKALDPVWPGGMDYVKINVILFCIVLPLVLRHRWGSTWRSCWESSDDPVALPLTP